jgi:ribosomal-protein-alanine N-acetyltransferase
MFGARIQAHKERIYMRIYGEAQKQDEIQTVICNKCKKNVNVENNIIKEGLYHTEYRFGYFSQKDGEVHSFDLCEECYDHIIGDFLIPPEINEVLEII